MFLACSSTPPEVPCRLHVATTQRQLDPASIDTVSTLPTEDEAPVTTDGKRTVKTSTAGNYETGFYYCFIIIIISSLLLLFLLL
jgi:hypothetical protein